MNEDTATTTIDLLRHGEPEGGEKFRGSIDDPLSELGWQQMRSAVASGAQWQQILSSPLLRCSEFAHELSTKHSLPIAIEPEMREIHFGDWEGSKSAELWKHKKHELLPFFRDPENNPPPNGEHMADFRERLVESWEKMLKQYRGQHILLVCHGGVIRVLLSQVLGLPTKHFARFDVPYACRSQLKVFHAKEGDYPLLASHTPLPSDTGLPQG